VAVWVTLQHKFEALFSLEKREGVRTISYRYRYRRDGIEIEGVLSGRDAKTGTDIQLKDIVSQAEKIIARRRNAVAPKPKSLIRTEDICDEIVALRKSKADATFEQIEIFFRKHIRPYLNEHCPYADNLNPTVWLSYKNFKRIESPDVSLFNHWKFFGMLFRHCYEKGILKQKFKLDFDEKKEDFRAPGKIIEDDLLRIFFIVADRTWHDRSLCQRLTGQRPGLIRRLGKDRVNLDSGVISVKKEESKNRREYSFIAPFAVLGILHARKDNDSPYFFPNRRNPALPMDKSLNGWHSDWKKAKEALLSESEMFAEMGVIRSAAYLVRLANSIQFGDDPFTPHDLRHTYLTHKFKNSKNPALVCYQCDLSLEEAMKTYIHFRAEDTKTLADEADLDAKSFK
jgi:integrase